MYSNAAYWRMRLGISFVILIRPSTDTRNFLGCTLVHRVSLSSLRLFQMVDNAAQTDLKSWTSSMIADSTESELAGRSRASFALDTISDCERRLVSLVSKELSI